MRPLRSCLVAAIVLAACGGGDEACPDDLPSACPPGAPGYASTIAPLVKARCTTCHTAGGQASDKPLGTWADLSARRREVLAQVYGCRMPPAGAAPLSSAERADLLAWLVCGAPDD